jgi:single-stranded DNA-binding protein
MIDALIGGTLHAAPEQRTSQAGKTFVTAKVRTPTAGGDALFVNVICFDRDTCTALLALGAGEQVHLAGQLTPKVWTPANGEPRPVLDMVATACLTVYAVQKRRDASKPAAKAPNRAATGRTPAAAGACFDDMGDDL